MRGERSQRVEEKEEKETRKKTKREGRESRELMAKMADLYIEWEGRRGRGGASRLQSFRVGGWARSAGRSHRY
jgi:hypothetical protein